jgi:hypothetical protein
MMVNKQSVGGGIILSAECNHRFSFFEILAVAKDFYWEKLSR